MIEAARPTASASRAEESRHGGRVEIRPTPPFEDRLEVLGGTEGMRHVVAGWSLPGCLLIARAHNDPSASVRQPQLLSNAPFRVRRLRHRRVARDDICEGVLHTCPPAVHLEHGEVAGEATTAAQFDGRH